MPNDDFDLFVDVPRGRPDTPGIGDLPKVAFASRDDIRRELSFAKGKIFYGAIDAWMVSSGVNMAGTPMRHAKASKHNFVGHVDDRHVFTVAGSRSGKGRAVLIPNMLLWPHSVISIDPKGELASETASHRHRHHGHKVVVLDPFRVSDVDDALRGGFNPLRGCTEENLIELSMLIADALVVTDPGSKDPHWTEAAKGILRGLIGHVATADQFAGDRNLGKIREIACSMESSTEDESGNRIPGAVETGMMQNDRGEGFIQRSASDFFSKPSNERGSVLSNLNRNLMFLDLPPIRRSLERSSFALSDLKTENTSVYLCLPARHMGTCGRWLRMLVNLTIQSMESTSRSKKMDGPVLMALDEMATLGHMQSILDAAGQMAGFGLKLWAFWQDLTQAKEIYGERWETFIANAGVMQCFGNTDPTTAEWISKRLGQGSVRVKEPRQMNARQAATDPFSANRKTEMSDLLAPHEVARLFAREDQLHRQLLFVSGMSPVIIQKVFYDTHEKEMRGEPLLSSQDLSDALDD
ncbi:type IV secretory system conjugative DNA transfer family protein [Rhodopirellula bahusiensis]|uniref:TRAG family protein n=1 Tax=Rhodopirellula bahusiensis TaxID=2014065 RepID=A0A2G1VXJ4_9BACT|nr:type IV secretory system conjugative DNA transfer family protein [Rhodopirellula bahusiensis]PHQ31492.1 TRAG family protein [Rhodopirellula bahusiensis]